MSFSRRSSKWANAALVVTVSSKDFAALDLHGPLAGVEFQVLLKCPYWSLRNKHVMHELVLEPKIFVSHVKVKSIYFGNIGIILIWQ